MKVVRISTVPERIQLNLVFCFMGEPFILGSRQFHSGPGAAKNTICKIKNLIKPMIGSYNYILMEIQMIKILLYQSSLIVAYAF